MALRLRKTPTAGDFVPEFTHFDSQGSALAATSAAGAVLWRESYTPFGMVRLNPVLNRDDTGYTGGTCATTPRASITCRRATTTR